MADATPFMALPIVGCVVLCACLANVYYWRRNDEEHQALVHRLNRVERDHVVIQMSPMQAPIPTAPLLPPQEGPTVGMYTIMEEPTGPDVYAGKN